MWCAIWKNGYVEQESLWFEAGVEAVIFNAEEVYFGSGV